MKQQYTNYRDTVLEQLESYFKENLHEDFSEDDLESAMENIREHLDWESDHPALCEYNADKTVLKFKEMFRGGLLK